MRLWSLHPSYLDAKGLVAAWREALLARAVLAGRTRGYRHHPQLERFRASPDPLAAIDAFLRALWDEAARRGYRFDETKLASPAKGGRGIAVTDGQLRYEYALLRSKLATRDPGRLASMAARPESIRTNPVFFAVGGGVESWERVVPGVGDEGT